MNVESVKYVHSTRLNHFYRYVRRFNFALPENSNLRVYVFALSLDSLTCGIFVFNLNTFRAKLADRELAIMLIFNNRFMSVQISNRNYFAFRNYRNCFPLGWLNNRFTNYVSPDGDCTVFVRVKRFKKSTNEINDLCL